MCVPKKHKTLGVTKSEFVKGKPDKKFSEWIWEVTKDVEPLTENDLPHVWYNLDGDILHVRTRLCDDGFEYSKWINHTLTMEYREGTPDEHLLPVGFELWGFSVIPDSLLDLAFDYLSKHGHPVSASLVDRISMEKKTAKSRLTKHNKARKLLERNGAKDAKKASKQ
jgi:hypothetical protein